MTSKLVEIDGWEAFEDASAEEGRTYGRLSIAGAYPSPATRVFDRSAKATRDFIYASAYPLAEWLAENYWFLTCIQGRKHRVNLMEAGGGYLMPDLTWRGLGTFVELRWKGRELAPDQPVDFIGSGRAMITLPNAERDVRHFIEMVLKRLGDIGDDSALHDAWSAVLASLGDPDETAWCRIVASLGLNPYQLTEDVRTKLAEADAALPQIALLTQLAPACDDIEQFVEKARLTAEQLEALGQHQAPGLAAIKEDMPRLAQKNQRGFELGYALAEAFRDTADAPSTFGSYTALTDWLLDVSEASGWLSQGAEDEIVHGILSSNGKSRVGISVAHARKPERMSFALARSLGEYFSTTSSVKSIISTTDTMHSRVGRAFAAELLAPKAEIRALVNSRQVDMHDVGRIADRFGVEPKVVELQIQNHHIAELSA